MFRLFFVILFFSITISSYGFQDSKKNNKIVKGDSLLRMAEVDKAIVYFKQLLNNSEEIKNDSIAYYTHSRLGKAYRRKGYYQLSLDHHLKAHKICEKASFNSLKINTKYQLSNIYSRLGDYQKAINFSTAVQHDAMYRKDTLFLGRIYSNKAMTFKNMKQADSAYYYIQKAAKIFEHVNDSASLSIVYLNQIGILELQTKLDSSRHYSKLLLEKFKLTPRVKANILAVKAKLDFNDKKYRSAKNWIEQIDISKGDGYYFKNLVYQLIAKINDSLGNHTKAKEALNLANKYQDSMTTEKNGIKAEEQNAIIAIHSKEIEVRRKEKEILLLRAEKRERILWIFLLISVGVILSFLLYKVFLKFNKKTDELLLVEKEKVAIKLKLEKKKREITQYTINDLNKKDQLLQIAKSDDLKKKIQNIYKDDNLKEFKIRFDEIHPEFYKKVHNQYPKLTHKETNFLALVGIRLSSKEIASLLNITAAGVQKSRYRIRKKMNLQPEEDLWEAIVPFLGEK